MSQLALTHKVRKRVLAVSIDIETYAVSAIETTIPSKDKKSPVSKMEHVFDVHAHTIIGQFKTLALAMTAAERFVFQWSKGTPFNQCSCGDSL